MIFHHPHFRLTLHCKEIVGHRAGTLRLWIACAVVCLLGVPASLHAQVRSAAITGTITDPTGAIVPNANITVTETATGVSYPSKSNSAGVYTVPYLEAGDYTVTVTKAGFQTDIVKDLRLDSAQTVREDIKLKVGAVSTQVTVNAAALSLDAENGTLQGFTPAKVIDVIPNITNNPFQYAELQNGVVPGNSTQATTSAATSFGVGVNGRTAFSDFSIDGAQQGENNIMIDGLPVMGGGYNDPVVVPNLEGLQSVQILANSYSAEYGRGAGQMSITTKSGTNQFHGLVSYENRNEALMANTDSNKINAVINPTNPAYRRPPFKVNDIGGEIGGPILHNRLFFTGSLHYLTHNYGVGESLHVPSLLERQGDFGETYVTGPNGQPTPDYLFNPFSVTAVPGATNVYQRAEFPQSSNCNNLYTDTTSSGSPGIAGNLGRSCGDVIPTPNPIGLYILSLYPKPNNGTFAGPNTGTDPYQDNNYATTIVNTLNQYTNEERVDYKRGRHSIYVSGGLQWDTLNNPNPLGSGVVQGFNNVGLVTTDRNYYVQIGDTVVFSPTLILDARYGFSRDHTASLGGNTSGFSSAGYASLGVAPATQGIMIEPGAVPYIAPGNPWESLTNYSQFNNKQEHQINHAGNASVTKLKGKWTFKAGGQFQIILENFNDFEEAAANLGGCCANDVGGANGADNYTIQYINATGQSVSGSPYDEYTQQNGAAGALTLVDEGEWFVRPGANLRPAYAAKYMAFYSQNDWKVTNKLTLNLGIRWELQPGITERYNRMAGYDFSKPNPLFPNTMGAIDFPGTMGYGRNLWNTEWHDWTPHLGFAYLLLPRLVARGGFAINYLPSNTGYFSSPNDLGEATWTSGNTGAQTYGANPDGVPTEVLTDSAPLVAATGANVLAPQTYGVGEAYFDRNLPNEVQDQFNFTMETSFGAKQQWLLSAGYVGDRENHLSTRNLNFENIQSISASNPGLLQAWRQTWINSNGTNQPQTANVPNPYQPTSGSLLKLQGSLASATVQQFIPYLPYPLLYGGGENGARGFASYDSLQLHLAHRTSALYLDANYTWSKSLGFVNSIVGGGNISSLDLLCNRCNRNYETTDVPNRVVVTAVYQLPFNDGQRWARGSRFARETLGGWTLSPVFLAQGGTPVTLSGGSGQFTSRVNYTVREGAVPLELPKSYQQHRYMNATTKVTLPCGIVVTPGLFNKLKYNPCAFDGPIVTTPNGSTLADEYWYGNGNQTNGNIRGPSRVDVQGSLRKTFFINERVSLDISADVTNLMNTAEWSSSPNGGAGGTDTVNNPASGQIPGLVTGGSYGQWGVGTYDPRQVEMVGRIVF